MRGFINSTILILNGLIFVGCNGSAGSEEALAEYLANSETESQEAEVNDQIVYNTERYLELLDMQEGSPVGTGTEWMLRNEWVSFVNDPDGYNPVGDHPTQGNWYRMSGDEFFLLSLKEMDFYVPLAFAIKAEVITDSIYVGSVFCDLEATFEGDNESGQIILSKGFDIYWEGTAQREACDDFAAKVFEYENSGDVLTITDVETEDSFEYIGKF